MSRRSQDGSASVKERPNFMVSAPGKTIVFGEHAVVHGKAALAAAISLRSYLLITPHASSQRVVTLAFPDVKLNHSWDIDELPWTAFAQSSKIKKYYERVTELDKELIDEMQPHLDAVSPDAPDHMKKIHQSAALAFLYLLMSLSAPDVSACTYTLRSTIPIAAGLGSSASISVCLSSALLEQNDHLTGPDPSDATSNEENINNINHWAFVGELCIHGTPSGVDNTVATRGKAVLFKRTSSGGPPQVTPLHEFPVLPLLLVDTKQVRSTATEVAKVKSLIEAHPTVTTLILDSIDKITESAHTLISSTGVGQGSPEEVQQLGELIRMNHGLLVSLGVSHPKLERIRELVDYSGIGWTKLTGAGGGGCAITILKPDAAQEAVHALEEDLAKEGFEKYETLLGGAGVGILRPQDGRALDFSQEAFLKAGDAQSIESLVGAGGQGYSEGWKFWDS